MNVNYKRMMFVFILLGISIMPGHSREFKQAPSFQLTDLKGNTVSLNVYKGDIVILNFWASWCAPCIKEMPALQKIHEYYKDKGLQVLGVAVVSNPEDIPDIVNKTGVRYPILIGNKQLIADYGYFTSIPHTFILNRSGQIVHEISGRANFREYKRVLQQWLP